MVKYTNFCVTQPEIRVAQPEIHEWSPHFPRQNWAHVLFHFSGRIVINFFYWILDYDFFEIKNLREVCDLRNEQQTWGPVRLDGGAASILSRL